MEVIISSFAQTTSIIYCHFLYIPIDMCLSGWYSIRSISQNLSLKKPNQVHIHLKRFVLWKSFSRNQRSGWREREEAFGINDVRCSQRFELTRFGCYLLVLWVWPLTLRECSNVHLTKTRFEDVIWRCPCRLWIMNDYWLGSNWWYLKTNFSKKISNYFFIFDKKIHTYV